ncbi:hypothetical protein [Desulfovibrio desulfuricans]|uniref:hypothetical protein n=1 Tax=Desulfovibrio desulfuricans TaxID=876 RepID=UPI003983F467
MSFRNILQDEVEQVFLNADEFAEEVTLNGLPVNAQVVWLQRDAALGQTPGLPQQRLRLHIAEQNAPDDTEDGVVLEYNGEDWTVESSQHASGILVLTLAKSGSIAGRW